jgi:hypothetical protein
MGTATRNWETDSQRHEKQILVERFRASVTSRIGARLPHALQAEAEAIGFCDLLELVIELECLDGTRCNSGDVIRMIEVRVEDLTS